MVIGITGGYCTGKTQVSRIFKKLGTKIIDLDQLAHQTQKPQTASFKKIVKTFGRDILVNNRIDRRRLARKVFGHKKRLSKLNSIVHPIIISKMLSLIKKFSKKYKVIAIEAPLLFEARLKNYFDFIIVVKTDKKTQIKRVAQNKGLKRKEILNRINSQWPLSIKVRDADFIIDNSGSIGKTQRQVREIWKDLNP